MYRRTLEVASKLRRHPEISDSLQRLQNRLFRIQGPWGEGNRRNELGKHTKKSGLQRHGSSINNLGIVHKELPVDEATVILPGFNFFLIETPKGRHSPLSLGGGE
jgi:hypothetical protein